MSVATIASSARTFLRDYPKYFEVELGPLNILTVRLPHPLIMASSVQAYVSTPPVPPATETTSVLTTAWQLDDRNGLIKFTDPTLLGKRVLIAAYHYTWFSDSELATAAEQSANETIYNTNDDIDDIDGVLSEVTAMGAVVRALWALSIELSLDIDVSTPEGMFIPARQRYQQVLGMMQYFENEYTQRAEALNIGLGALEQFTLRRVAYLTNRYVPLYVPREVDDPRWPQRIYPPIPDQTIEGSTPDREGVYDILDVSTPEERYRAGQDIGWVHIGTRGELP